MRAILKYDLPEEKEEFYGASHAYDFWNCLFEFNEYLRGILKHGDMAEEADKMAEEIRKQLWEIMETNHVNLEEFS